MMNRAVKRFTSAALTLAMLMSMGVVANAKPTSSKLTGVKPASSTGAASAAPAAVPAAAANDYSVNMAGNDVQFIRGGSVVGSYAAKSPDAKLMLSKSGNLVLNFTKSDGSPVNVSLGQQKAASFSGTYGVLTVDGSVPNDRGVTVSGTAGELNVNAPVYVSVAAGASVASLKVGSGAARVNIAGGAKVTKASAVSASSVTGFSGSVSKMQAAATAPSAKTVNLNSNKTGLKVGSTTSAGTSTAGKETVYLDMQEADSTGNTSEINFTSNNGVELIAKNGVSLGLAMKDVVLKVTHDTDKDNDRVGGSWKWVDAASTTHVSGTYTYRFYPSLSSKYPTVDVTVKYTGDGDSNSSKSLGKPSISFGGKSHGPDGKDISVDVKIPSGVDDDSTLTIYVDRDAYNEWNLDEDDAGEENRYTVYIPGGHDSDDEIRIQAKVDSGGRKTSSNTIKYRVDKDGGSSSLSGFSVSASSRSIEKGEKVTVKVDIPSNATNPRLSTRVDGGSVTHTGSVNAGRTTEIEVKATKTGEMTIAVTLKCDEGSPVKYCYVDVDDDD